MRPAEIVRHPRAPEREQWLAALAWARAAFEDAYHRGEAGRGAVIEDLLLAA